MIEVAMHSLLRLFLFCAFLLPLLSGCKSTPTPNDPAYVDAVEVKLKCRELADQMLATMPNDALQGFVAMPTSFVDQNNTSRSSPLGRLMGEALFYEFNQRGFPTREYRLTGHISVEGGRDDLALAANQIVPTKGQKWAALVVGTYYVDKDATFVNARLVRASDGLVLRTGQLVLVNTPIIARMGKTDPAPVAAKPAAATAQNERRGLYPSLYTPASSISSGSIPIKQGK
ncbi:FlgO family outer membrane protein [Desulfovibrio fairfieldensis]|nr:FlgO family outer membrane protein [Desulfovibrio fairfieldensis]